MVNELLPMPKGWITIYGIDKEGNRKLLVDRKNALVANSKKIMVHTLGQDSSYAITNIEVYKAASLLATSPLLTISFPVGDTSVKFTARFNEASFNDTFDELKLVSTAGGIFSEVTGLSVLKDNTLQLEIEWLLTIN